MSAVGTGCFFKKLTGHDASEFDGLSDIDAEVAKVIGHDIPVEFYQSSLISPRGSVFPVESYEDKIESQIDRSFF